MPPGLNRALQVRAADRLRAVLARDEVSGLPRVGCLTELDQRELCDVGGGRLAVIAIRAEASAVREVADIVEGHVRRTDLVGLLHPEMLLVVAPALDAVGGQDLLERLRGLLGQLPVSLGIAYRSKASGAAWSASALAEEAELHGSHDLAAGPDDASIATGD